MKPDTYPTQIVNECGIIPRMVSACPQCGGTYISFPSPGFKGDQSVCQACADENFAPTREKMQKIERVYAVIYRDRMEYAGPFAALSGATA